MNIPSRFGFYAILTDPVKGYEYVTKLLVDYGVSFVQLRMKEKSRDEILSTANLMRKLTLGTDTRFIVNDYPDIARECGADGVHIGQDDINFSEAREILGKEAIIGISTHSPTQTLAACELKPDYIGVGPVFPTPTKKNPDPVIGIDGMKRMFSVSDVPAVAIGGIDLKNLHTILEAGAENFCMVRQLTKSEDPEKVLKEALRIYREYYPG
jgi:thiamine-phosphate pyrophosphorylase